MHALWRAYRASVPPPRFMMMMNSGIAHQPNAAADRIPPPWTDGRWSLHSAKDLVRSLDLHRPISTFPMKVGSSAAQIPAPHLLRSGGNFPRWRDPASWQLALSRADNDTTVTGCALPSLQGRHGSWPRKKVGVCSYFIHYFKSGARVRRHGNHGRGTLPGSGTESREPLVCDCAAE